MTETEVIPRPGNASPPRVQDAVKRGRVRLLVTIVLFGTVLSIIYHYASANYLGRGYPRSTFLFLPSNHFMDYDNLYLYARSFLHGVPGDIIYFPLAIFTALASTLVPVRVGWALMIALFLLVLGFMLRTWVVDREESAFTKAQYLFILVALSYPVLFALDRSNFELILFVLFAGFFYFQYVRGSTWLAALCLAAAIAFKLYPATLIVLLIAERRFKTAALTVALALGLTALSVAAMAGLSHFSLHAIWQMNVIGKSRYQRIMVTAGGGVQHGHSLWGLVELPTFLNGVWAPHWRTSLYEVAALLIFALISVHVVVRETERWKRVLLLMVSAVFLPFVSADYTLIQLYFPLVFFLNSPRVSRWDRLYVAMFAVLLIPVDYYYLTTNSYGVSISVVVYPLALVGLMALAILDPAHARANTLERPLARGPRGHSPELAGDLSRAEAKPRRQAVKKTHRSRIHY